MWENYKYSPISPDVSSDAEGNSIFSTAPDVIDFSNLDFIKEVDVEELEEESEEDEEEEEKPKYTIESRPPVSFENLKKYLIKILFSDDQYTQFYLDNNSSFSEEFSNSTME